MLSLNRYLYFLLLTFMVSCIVTRAQDTIRSPELTYFPEKKIFPTLFMDPFEPQISGGFNAIYKSDMESDRYMGLVNLGFSKPFISFRTNRLESDISLFVASQHQFIISDSDIDSMLIGGLISSDFEVGGSVDVGIDNNRFQARVYHRSSHYGDDYILRNNITEPNNRSGNYEQAEITWLRLFGRSYLYIGSGLVFSKYAYRERLSIWLGSYLEQNLKCPSVSIFEAVDLRYYKENNANPGIRVAVGLNISNSLNSDFKIWLDLYSGSIPYGTIDYGRVSLVGLAGALVFE